MKSIRKNHDQKTRKQKQKHHPKTNYKVLKLLSITSSSGNPSMMCIPRDVGKSEELEHSS